MSVSTCLIKGSDGSFQKPEPQVSLDPRTGGLPLLIGNIYRQWRRQVDLSLKELELTEATRSPLLMLKRIGLPVKQKDLAQMLYLDPSSLVRVLDQLREMALVDWQTHSADRRTKYIALTPKGHIWAEKLLSKSMETEKQVLLGIPQEELKNMQNTLEKISRNLHRM